ncbi:MFS general substrate transporter [Eremomyces bilateralis CBS 781.70]|uniref:MFS general substrate transporter n=1 Tax=Eremomyces bilateralis CBS 781.70 TaxID=1392243 RepID=A0A6G1FRJ7_9PEZI|nr:MFS general substrate transporter [Eremomyces bilateralis CBS 781.70]KAF1808340.1 MFS general substrate transporter [Eremomyces bilateralis CBS 781.70]
MTYIGTVQYWVSVLIAVYGAALFVASPICGFLADRTSSRRLPLLWGLIALAASTVILNVGSSVAVLIVGRILQGLSAAVVWVVGLALLVDTVGAGGIGEAVGWIALSMTMGLMLGPLLGGVVYQRAGYNAVFAMAYTLIGIDIILRLMLIEQKVALRWIERKDGKKEAVQLENRDSKDPQEQCKPKPAVGTEGADEGISQGIAPSATTLQGAVAVHPPVPKQKAIFDRLPPVITLLASRRMLAAVWGIMAQASLLTAFDATLPLFVAQTFGWDSVGAGLLFLTIVIPSFVSPVVGKLSDKYGPRIPAAFGFLFSAPFLVLLRFVDHNSLRQKVLLCALLSMVGFALATCLPPLTAEISYLVEAKERRSPGRFGANGAMAQAYGLFNMAFAAGCAIGPIWGGMVLEKAGWPTMGWSLALFSGVSVIPVAIWCGGSIFKKRRRADEEETGNVGNV